MRTIADVPLKTWTLRSRLHTAGVIQAARLERPKSNEGGALRLSVPCAFNSVRLAKSAVL